MNLRFLVPSLAALMGGSPGDLPGGATTIRPRSISGPGAWRRIALLILLGVLSLAGWRLWKAEPRSGAPAANFPLTVDVHGPDGPQDLVLREKGAVLLFLGSDHRREPIREKGQAYFQEIPASFRGQPVNLALDADGYELADSRPRRLDGASLDLTVRRSPGTSPAACRTARATPWRARGSKSRTSPHRPTPPVTSTS